MSGRFRFMLEERRARIVEKLQHERTLKVKSLTKQFRVSIETIRRDLEYLEKEGFLKRVYGGAVRPEMFSKEPSYMNRAEKNYPAKKAIAQEAASMIEDGDTVFFDIGTTCLEVAKHLGNKKNLHVITNSLLIASELTRQPGCRVTLLGGELRNGEMSVSGCMTGNNLLGFNADKAVIGAGGITPELVITDYHCEEAFIRKEMIEHAKYSIVVCDSSKIGVTAVCNICSLEKVGVLITDSGISGEITGLLENAALSVVVVSPKAE